MRANVARLASVDSSTPIVESATAAKVTVWIVAGVGSHSPVQSLDRVDHESVPRLHIHSLRMLSKQSTSGIRTSNMDRRYRVENWSRVAMHKLIHLPSRYIDHLLS